MQICDIMAQVEICGNETFFVSVPEPQMNKFAGKAPALRGTKVSAACLDNIGTRSAGALSFIGANN
jgi:hypothetical protein